MVDLASGRNKRTITLNVGQPDGADVLKRWSPTPTS